MSKVEGLFRQGIDGRCMRVGVAPIAKGLRPPLIDQNENDIGSLERLAEGDCQNSSRGSF